MDFFTPMKTANADLASLPIGVAGAGGPSSSEILAVANA